MAILIAIEHDHQRIHAGTSQVIRAAAACGDEIVACVIGQDCVRIADVVAQIAGVSKVILVEHPAYKNPLAEQYAVILASLMPTFDGLLMGGTTYGKNILPRVAAVCGMTSLSDVIQVIDPRTFVRPMYAGNAIERVELLEPKTFFTVRISAFEPIHEHQPACLIENRMIAPIEVRSAFISQTGTISHRPDLSRATRIVSGGRGLQSAEQFKLIESLADVLGAAIGASRAAVDAGFISNDHQVGQTGKVVAPELYIAVGISGAIQHIAGMKDSKIIVAINKDEDAPIFQWADYRLVGDLFSIVPELIQALKEQE